MDTVIGCRGHLSMSFDILNIYVSTMTNDFWCIEIFSAYNIDIGTRYPSIVEAILVIHDQLKIEKSLIII